MALILVVEDERLLRWSLEQRLSEAGHTVHLAATLGEAQDHLRRHQPDLMILDLRLPDGHGLDFYHSNQNRLEETVVVVITAVGEVEDAVRAMKLGALDFLTKPVDDGELVRMVDKSVVMRGDRLEMLAARQRRERELNRDVVARSESFCETLQIAAEVAASPVTSVLIQGESGTGKNVIARHIHRHSAREPKPFLQVNCAAIPDQLLESELFGHEKGAFTDAKATKRGTFELADGGTVVLDEIGELRLELQSKLLQFLEDRSIRRVGGIREIHVDLRVIAITNRDIKAMVREKTFRDDLFYRLNVFPLVIPPLRERHQDILALAGHFVESLKGDFGRDISGFTRDAENMLLAYSWPGNVRELRNAIERAMILETGNLIGIRSLVLDRVEIEATPTEGQQCAQRGIVPLAELEDEMIHRALQATENNQTRAAEMLGITRDQLRYRLTKSARNQ
ncbi:MAG: sigma-54-dependent Fis family transcriptional regulator [bacterium]|nr:sigma-54-dependent Fis family transcriptional regulator [bacterium]